MIWDPESQTRVVQFSVFFFFFFFFFFVVVVVVLMRWCIDAEGKSPYCRISLWFHCLTYYVMLRLYHTVSLRFEMTAFSLTRSSREVGNLLDGVIS